MYIEAFTSHFGALTDARQSAKVTYPLEDILFITLCAPSPALTQSSSDYVL